MSDDQHDWSQPPRWAEPAGQTASDWRTPAADRGGWQQGHQQPYGQPAWGQPSGYAGGTKPDNNLVWAILATLFCCLPFGIVAIVNAAKVDGLWAGGRYAEAQSAASAAKRWSLISAAIAPVWVLGWFAFAFLGVVAGA